MRYNSTEQSVSWFREQYLAGNLTIRPPYQRKPVWADRQRSWLIESILLELPIPEIFIQEVVDPGGTASYAVVDGQQRIRTVLQFIGVDQDPGEATDNGFALTKLPATSEWINKSLDDLTDSERVAFFGYKFGVRLLKTDDDTQVRGLFARLNRFLLPLTAAELRNAIYLGPFARLATRLADDEYWAQQGIVTAAAIRRMHDMEFCADLMIGVLHGPQDGADETINQYYQQYEDFEDEFPEQRTAVQRFNRTLEVVQKALPGIRKTRWSNKADFYSLFVAVAHLSAQASRVSIAKVRLALSEFSGQIDRFRTNPEAQVSQRVVSYVRALERGANGKTRRAARHSALTSVLRPAFEPRQVAARP